METVIEWTGRASSDDVAQVLALAGESARMDGPQPLSEQTRLDLRHGAPGALEGIARDKDTGRVVGFAHLDLSDTDEGPSGELFVAPSARGAGVGRALAESMTQQAGDGLRVWAHGRLAAADRLATSLGFAVFRELWQMRRPTSTPVPEVPSPPGVVLRTFEVGRDEDAWLALNAKAFAHHPEQGSWTADDLQRRIAEPWFDPAGFFLAEDSATGALVGFHWTKTHPATGSDGPLGEVYVVGVDPDAQGGGLGRLLTAVGLRHLAETRVDGQEPAEVLLYVDADNESAVRVYTKLGFRVTTVDVMYRGPELM